MGGFNYGGKGDGTSWSSERGNGPEPGGGDRGNSGNHDKGRSRSTLIPRGGAYRRSLTKR